MESLVADDILIMTVLEYTIRIDYRDLLYVSLRTIIYNSSRTVLVDLDDLLITPVPNKHTKQNEESRVSRNRSLSAIGCCVVGIRWWKGEPLGYTIRSLKADLPGHFGGILPGVTTHSQSVGTVSPKNCRITSPRVPLSTFWWP
jgi:hypothetical protein